MGEILTRAHSLTEDDGDPAGTTERVDAAMRQLIG